VLYRFFPLCVLIACLAGIATQVRAQALTTLPQVVEHAVLNNPEILTRFNSFQASLEAQGVQRGGLLPQVDVQGGYGKEWRNATDTDPITWNRPTYRLEVRQLLFDGLSLRNSVRQLGFQKLSSYYELLAAVDSVALEAVDAYLDVQRYREMTRLASDNFRIHEHTLKLLRDRQTSGVGRGVDLQQAIGRMALAQTNLITETNNLNDVTQRYIRIVGQPPAENLAPAPDVSDQLPSRPANFADALRTNPGVLAKQALVQAAEASRAAARGRFSPTLELRASTGRDRDVSSSNVQSTTAQLVLNYNLYRGGADSARLRQAAAEQYAARDVRNYTCRNAQQELSVTWNNIARLQYQLPFLRTHRDAMSKVRVAAEQQFQIGQRSLLDLLNTSNELFDARRALLNGEYDLAQRRLRWLALSHRVLPALGLAQPHEQAPEEAAELAFSDDALAACLAPAPDTRNLQPVQITYGEGLQPPTLTPLAAPAASSPKPPSTAGPGSAPTIR